MTEFFFQNGRFVAIFHILPCWRDNMKSFSFILLKFVIHITNKKFWDKFDNILRQKFDLVGALSAGYCRVCSCLKCYCI